jgi:hypothetical protein
LRRVADRVAVEVSRRIVYLLRISSKNFGGGLRAAIRNILPALPNAFGGAGRSGYVELGLSITVH